MRRWQHVSRDSPRKRYGLADKSPSLQSKGLTPGLRVKVRERRPWPSRAWARIYRSRRFGARRRLYYSPAPALLGGIASSGAHATVQLKPLPYGTFQSLSPVDIAALIL